MIRREAAARLLHLASNFKAVAVTGPRQSGKTTLVKALFPQHPYVSLENPDTRNFAMEDARGFLAQFPLGAILDEVQRTPEIFSYLQEIIDNSKEKGQFILTGSNNFLLHQSISQSLAGRVGYLNLLPFSTVELNHAGLLGKDENAIIHQGFYPPVFDQQIPPNDWYPNYIRTYIERDIRQIKNISDLIVFERFLRLLAGRNAQELNYSSLGLEAGIDSKTAQSWVGLLESSYIIFLLKPYYKNYNKTLVKRPKVYFYDTGLVCNLLGINEVVQLTNHPLRGSIFESLIVSEFVKYQNSIAANKNFYYWRDKTGHEIDLIIETANEILPIEIKSGRTVNPEYFKNLRYFLNLANVKNGTVLFSGYENQRRSEGLSLLNWYEYLEELRN